MAYVKMSCPSCGSTVEHSGDKEFFFCEYCGTKIIKEKQFVELSGSVAVSGIASTNTLLERAFLFLEDQDYVSADEYLEKTLDADPKCAKAYIGKLMCQLRMRDINALATSSIPLTKYAFYNKAIRFASPDECQQYQSYNQAILDRIAATKEAKLKEIDALKQRVAELEAYIEGNKKQNLKNTVKKIICRILLILSVCGVVFWTVGTIIAFPIIIIDIPFVIWMIFMIRSNNRIKNSTQQYDTAKSELVKTQFKLSKRITDYNNWLQNNTF